MNRARKLVLVLLILSSVFIGSAFVAHADADLTEGYLYCNYVEAYGPSDAPYVTLYIYNPLTDEGYYTVTEVVGGSWSTGFFFPDVPEGTYFEVEAWGSLADYDDFDDPNYWDGGAYFVGEANCSSTAVLEPLPEVPAPEMPGGESPAVPVAPVTSSCSNPLPSSSVVYSVPLGAPAYYAADLQTATNFSLPAGTWKISEFSGDFAKVWIACEASPIWIPRSAVGGVID